MSFRKIIRSIGRERLSNFDEEAKAQKQAGEQLNLEVERKALEAISDKEAFTHLVHSLSIKNVFEEFNREILEGKGTIDEPPITFVEETRGTWHYGPSWDSGSGSYSGGESAHLRYDLVIAWTVSDEERAAIELRAGEEQRNNFIFRRNNRVDDHIPSYSIEFACKSSEPQKKLHWEMRGPGYNPYVHSDVDQYLIVRNFEMSSFEPAKLSSRKLYEGDIKVWIPDSDNFRSLIVGLYIDICLKHGNQEAIRRFTQD